MALPDFSKFKAPYRFVPEGGAFRLYENGEKTRTTFKTMAEAKKKVLALNNAWRASPAGRKASPRKKYDAQGRIVRKPARRAARARQPAHARVPVEGGARRMAHAVHGRQDSGAGGGRGQEPVGRPDLVRVGTHRDP